MKVEPTPTSPKARQTAKSEEIAALYREHGIQTLQRPPRGPRVSIATLILAVVFGFLAGIIGDIVLNVYFLDSQSPLLKALQLSNQSSVTQGVARDRKSSADIEQRVDALNKTLLALYDLQPLGTYYDQNDQRGTAVLISDDGWAMTTASAFPEEKDLAVVTTDRRVFQATNRVTDPASDLVFFRIDGSRYSAAPIVSDEPLTTMGTYTAVAGSGSETLLYYAPVRISRVRQPVGTLESSELRSRVAVLDTLLPAAYLGGPLMDDRGRVVALVSGEANSATVALPASYVGEVLATLLRDHVVRRPFIGIHYVDIAAVPGVPESVRFGRTSGALITGQGDIPAVSPHSPADDAGLVSGDLLVQIGGRPLTDHDSFSDLLQQYKPDDTIELTVIRIGKEQKLKVTLERIVAE